MTNPLHIRAILGELPDDMLKVVGPSEFASGRYPLERCVLDLRTFAAPLTEALRQLPFAGFLADAPDILDHHHNAIYIPCDAVGTVGPGDVIEVLPTRSQIAVRYRRGENGNLLFTTERCNNYCLMCSQPPRDVADEWRVAQLRQLVELIEPDEPDLAISGGEPTLLGEALADLVQHCSEHLPQTRLHILSNGRHLSAPGYAARFDGIHPLLSWGIPLYGANHSLHDYVVQAKGAFAETINGIYAAARASQHIEIRIVLVKPVVEHLRSLANYICRNLPFVEHVALMGTEPIGFAKAHQPDLWIDPMDANEAMAEAIELLDASGMAVSIYNVPLCVLKDEIRGYARDSISHWKRTFLPACESCSLKDRCAGFFSWITPAWTSRGISPVKLEVM